VALGGTERHSEVFSGTERHSEVFSGTYIGGDQRSPLTCTQ
jgi:hypothetical protein